MWIDHGDPVQQVIDAETAADHAKATERGLRALDLTNLVLCALDGHGLVRDQEQARIVIWAALADGMFGNASVDIPKMTRR
jgi:hypothetical protein